MQHDSMLTKYAIKLYEHYDRPAPLWNTFPDETYDTHMSAVETWHIVLLRVIEMCQKQPPYTTEDIARNVICVHTKHKTSRNVCPQFVNESIWSDKREFHTWVVITHYILNMYGTSIEMQLYQVELDLLYPKLQYTFAGRV